MSVSAAKQQSIPSIWQCAVASALLKALLFPAYRSTDFEVHRNWLALTHSLPVSQWYYEKTSEWTLDYPPFFAYFEYALAKVARYFDVNMLKVNNLNYASDATVAYQRLSAVFTELFLAYALHEFVQRSDVKSRRLSLISALSIFLSPAFLIIDHIHFQYNGFLFGIFVLSLTLARNPHTRLHSGILFAVLLCFKHIFLYIAPAYFVFLLRAYCLEEDFSGIRFGNCVKLGTALVAVFGAAFGPFALMGQMPQVLSRLFPFSRGLCHAYWAPNVWALYSFLDRIAIIVAPGLGLSVRTEALNSVTRGLVGDTAFAVLPDITPRATFIVTLLFQLIALAKLSLAPTWKVFVAVTTLCGYASFLFGWHVHEKAILLVIIPFSLVILQDRRLVRIFRPLAAAGYVSLFPLLFTAAETPVKYAYTLLWILIFFTAFSRASVHSSSRTYFLDRISDLYIAGLLPLLLYTTVIHNSGLFGLNQYEFLPLMFTSVYCALGVVGSWIGLNVVVWSW